VVFKKGDKLTINLDCSIAYVFYVSDEAYGLVTCTPTSDISGINPPIYFVVGLFGQDVKPEALALAQEIADDKFGYHV